MLLSNPRGAFGVFDSEDHRNDADGKPERRRDAMDDRLLRPGKRQKVQNDHDDRHRVQKRQNRHGDLQNHAEAEDRHGEADEREDAKPAQEREFRKLAMEERRAA